MFLGEFAEIIRVQLRDSGADPRVATDETVARFVNLTAPIIVDLRPEANSVVRDVTLDAGAYHKVPDVLRVLDVQGMVVDGLLVRHLSFKVLEVESRADPEWVQCSDRDTAYFEYSQTDPTAVWLQPAAKAGEVLRILAAVTPATVSTTEDNIEIAAPFLISLKDLVMSECYQTLDGGMSSSANGYRQQALSWMTQDAAEDAQLERTMEKPSGMRKP